MENRRNHNAAYRHIYIKSQWKFHLFTFFSTLMMRRWTNIQPSMQSDRFWLKSMKNDGFKRAKLQERFDLEAARIKYVSSSTNISLIHSWDPFANRIKSEQKLPSQKVFRIHICDIFPQRKLHALHLNPVDDKCFNVSKTVRFPYHSTEIKYLSWNCIWCI